MRHLAILIVLGLPGIARADAILPLAAGESTSSGSSLQLAVGQLLVEPIDSGDTALQGGFHAAFQAPSGLLEESLAISGEQSTVSARLFDNIGIVSASLHYRRGGQAAFQRVPMSRSAGDRWSADIPSEDVGVFGVQYFVTASDGELSTRLPTASPADVANLSVEGTFSSAILAAKQHTMLGLSFLASSADPEDVFDELRPYDPAVWRLATYEPGSSLYREPASAADLVPGRGFWFIVADAGEFSTTGTSTPLDGPFPISLSPGFNLIANPFAFAVPVQSIAIPNGVDANFLTWNGSGYTAERGALAPFSGYWIYNGNSSPTTLFLPPGPPLNPVPEPSNPEAPDGWAARVIVEGRAADPDTDSVADDGLLIDDSSRFGMRTGASADRDAGDFVDPPSPPAGFVNAAWETGSGPSLQNDYRALSGEAELWALLLRSDSADRRLRVRIEFESPMVEGWAVELLDPIHLDLIAHGTAQSGLDFETQVLQSGERRFWVLAGPRDSVDERVAVLESERLSGVAELVLERPYPNPVHADRPAHITLQVPESASIDLAVFDIAGRRVRTIHSGSLDRGYHHFLWDGHGPRGRRAATGVYLLRLDGPSGVVHRKLVLAR